MSGEHDLSTLLKTLSADLIDGVFVFVTISPDDMPHGLIPRMLFHEAEGITLILPREEALAHGLAHEFPCRMITLNVHSALDAVGFIAHIATELAKHQMGVNPVAGFYHDHLFVPEDRAEDTMKVLRELTQAASA